MKKGPSPCGKKKKITQGVYEKNMCVLPHLMQEGRLWSDLTWCLLLCSVNGEEEAGGRW